MALIFHICFKCAVRPDWRCRGYVVTIVMRTASDADESKATKLNAGDNEDA